MRKFFFLFLLLGVTLLFLSTSYSTPSPEIEGKWAVKGRMSTGATYTGSVSIKKKSFGRLGVSGRYDLDGENEKIASFNSSAKFDGKVLTFRFYIQKVPGVLTALRDLGADAAFGRSKRIRVDGKFTLSPDGTTFTGGWSSKAQKFSGQETWTTTPKVITVTSVNPKEFEGGSEGDKVFTITGTNLPSTDEVSPKDIAFLLGGKADARLAVKEILESNDDGTSLTVRVSVAKDVAAGERDVQVKTGVGKGLLKITKGTKKLPLGGSVEISLGESAKIFVPQKGGILKIFGLSQFKLLEGSLSGSEVKKSDQGGFEIEKAGWYYVDLSQSELSANLKLSSTYDIDGKTADDKMPWNFWYYPFMQKWSPSHNLYSDGGVYEKLDKIFKIKEDPEGWKKFSPYRHMDRDVESSEIKKLAEKFYKGFKWTEPEDEKDKELLKKHNPSTMKGYAWCYARSTDGNKSWWGHCWGAVVASSLWTQPESKTITLENGEKVTFNEEETEGIIVSYYTNHSIVPVNYMRNCPAGRPTDKLNEDVDDYADDFFLGLLDGVKEKGLPLACNLRAEATDDDSKGQVWNHVVWKFEAKMKEVEGDETLVEIELTVYATNDIFPSAGVSSPRIETYTMRLKYNSDGTVDRDNGKFQNWTAAKHYCPSYLWRITKSADESGTENAVLRGKIDQLVKFFGYKKIE